MAFGIGEWLREPDSNRRPPAHEAGELPLLYPAVKWVGYFQPARRSARVKRNSACRRILAAWMLIAELMRRS